MFDLNAFLDRGPIKLVAGSGNPKTGGCWMSVLSLYAGEDWTDEPDCVCPVIAELCTRANDMLPSDEARGRLIGPRMFDPVGTRTNNPDIMMRRKSHLVDAAARRFAPLAAETVAGALPDEHDKKYLLKLAGGLRAMHPLSDAESLAAGKEIVKVLEQIVSFINIGGLDTGGALYCASETNYYALMAVQHFFGFNCSHAADTVGDSTNSVSNACKAACKDAAAPGDGGEQHSNCACERFVTEHMLPLIDELIAIGDKRPVEPACSEQQLAQACQLNA